MGTAKFDSIVESANRPNYSLFDLTTEKGLKEAQEKHRDSWIECGDGTRLSAFTGWGTYCLPRPGMTRGTSMSFDGPFTHVEVMLYDGLPEVDEWEQYNDFGGVYGYVPARLVREFIEAHGGEK